MRPIRFHDAVQRHNSILRVVRRPADHEIPALRRLENERNLEGEDSGTKMRGGMQVAVAGQVFNRQTFRRRGAIPNGADVMGRENFPAVLVRHHQRQTAIRELLFGIVHPFPFATGRADWRGIVLVDLVGSYLVECFRGRSFFFLRRAFLCGGP